VRPPELLAWQWLLRPGWPAATRLLLPAHWQQHAYIFKRMIIFREAAASPLFRQVVQASSITHLRLLCEHLVSVLVRHAVLVV
jgi:hypothetical protein